MAVDVFSSHRHDDAMRLDRHRAAIVVIDMVNEFCKPGGAMVLPGYETLVPPQLAVIEAARAAGVPVIWVHDAHRPGMRREREWVKRTPHCVEGS
ncbi:isochorismatase family protein, partial [Mesorhizobium sp. M00.F.Ca.ET.158.01.1.1]